MINVFANDVNSCCFFDCSFGIYTITYIDENTRKYSGSDPMKYLDNIKRIDIPDFDDEESEIIKELHKKLLKRSMNKNDSNEVGMLVNLQDWTNIMINGTENGVTLKKDKAASNLICTAPKNSLLFFHNHPKNSCFSEKDLESFMISDAIKMMSVVCNNGRLYYLIKMDTFDKCEALMHYETIYSKIESGSVKEFLRTCSKVGLKFIYGGE